MDEELRKALADEMVREFKQLETVHPGTEEQRILVDNVTKLYKTGIEDAKSDSEYDEVVTRREMEQEKILRDEEAAAGERKHNKILGYVKVGLEGASIVLPLVFYGIWMRNGFKFEETGAFTSTTFRGLIQKFRPTK